MNKDKFSKPADSMQNINEMGDNPNDPMNYGDSSMQANSDHHNETVQPIMRPYGSPNTAQDS